MSKEQYNSFDDWFREAAAQPGPIVHDAAWQAMEAKLNGQKKRRRGIIFWWWFGGLFLVGGILLLARFENGRTVDEIKQAAKLRVISPEEPSLSENTEKETYTGKAIRKSKLDIPEPGTKGQGRVAENKTDRELSHSNSNSKTVDQDNAVARKDTDRPAGAGLGTINRLAKKTSKAADFTGLKTGIPAIPLKKGITAVDNNKHVLNGAERNEANQVKTGIQPENLPITEENSIEKKIIQADQPNPPVVHPGIDSTVRPVEKPNNIVVGQDTTVMPKKAGKKPEKHSHFYLFGAVAPEWSYVKNRGAGDIALSYGGAIGYKLSKKWAIQVGLFKSVKKYRAGEGDYTPKKGSYYDNPNIVIESVDADCDVLEIPVAVRYNFLQQKKWRFFTMAGVVSAIMKKEAYDYDYINSGSPRYSSYTYKTGAFHLFSAASFSVGLEQQLNRNLSLLMAPYFNIPLQGIGEGKVQLNSFGVQGGLKYNLPF